MELHLCCNLPGEGSVPPVTPARDKGHSGRRHPCFCGTAIRGCAACPVHLGDPVGASLFFYPRFCSAALPRAKSFFSASPLRPQHLCVTLFFAFWFSPPSSLVAAPFPGRHLSSPAPCSAPVICVFCIPDGVAGPSEAGRLFLALRACETLACAVRNPSSPCSLYALRVGVWPRLPVESPESTMVKFPAFG